ncbi:hypothetical protein llap_7750 [Limosa lapponica baueri]|uniref:Uncharacterized protein n=1 Tax=Limosa lapponica baueri TaxID=1758121 RepID=A0A2I0U7A4_LIMLA|nr:hypothetical protein llap_7750 [Limosa lapponica baueri]
MLCLEVKPEELFCIQKSMYPLKMALIIEFTDLSVHQLNRSRRSQPRGLGPLGSLGLCVDSLRNSTGNRFFAVNANILLVNGKYSKIR